MMQISSYDVAKFKSVLENYRVEYQKYEEERRLYVATRKERFYMKAFIIALILYVIYGLFEYNSRPEVIAERQEATRIAKQESQIEKQAPARKRDLYLYEIRNIAEKYGLEIRHGLPTDNEINWYGLKGIEDYEILAKHYWGWIPPYYYIALMSCGVRYRKAEMFDADGGFISYDELRNNPVYTRSYIREKVKCMDEYSNQLVKMLIELKEL